MRISDWSSDVCSSDLVDVDPRVTLAQLGGQEEGDVRIVEAGDDRLRAPPEKVAPQGIARWAPLEQKAGKCHSERFLAARIGLGPAAEIYQEAAGAKKCLHSWIEGGRAEVSPIDASRQNLAQIEFGRRWCRERGCQHV